MFREFAASPFGLVLSQIKVQNRTCFRFQLGFSHAISAMFSLTVPAWRSIIWCASLNNPPYIFTPHGYVLILSIHHAISVDFSRASDSHPFELDCILVVIGVAL